MVDKTGVAAGASGIACGVVRNNYFQPAMQELMAACVEIWESDPETLHYHGSGYVALGPAAQEADLVAGRTSARSGSAIRSELVTGEAGRLRRTCAALYPDWRARGLTVCLHEQRGGFAFNRESMLGLADKARAAGAEIAEGVEVTGFELDGSGAVTRGADERGRDRRRAGRDRGRPVDRRRCGRCSACRTGSTSTSPTAPSRPTARCGPTGTCRRARSTSTRRTFVTPTGAPSPVLHVDSDAPLRDDDGR